MTAPWDQIEGMRGPTPGNAAIRGIKHDTFVTYRPLNQCRFCQRKIDDEMATEGYTPPDTELVCPHVRRRDLDDLLARAVRNEIANLRMNTTTLPSGIVQVTVMWDEIDGRKVEAERHRPTRL